MSLEPQMLMLLEQETGKNDHLRQKRKQDKQFVYDRLFNEDSNQVSVYVLCYCQVILGRPVNDSAFS